MRTDDPTFENVERLVRSSRESVLYKPDWRNSQVELFLNEIRIRGIEHRPALPKREDDRYVQDLYDYRLGVFPQGGRISNAMRWCDGLLNAPDYRPLCVLKALLVADRSDEDVAESMGVPTHYIEWFEKIYWNVRPLQFNIHHLVAFVLDPLMLSAVSDREKLEKLYFRVAIHCGREELDAIISGDFSAPPEVLARLEQFACNNLVVQGAIAMIMDCDRLPDRTDIDRWLKLRKNPGRRELADGGQAAEAIEGKDLMVDMINAFWDGDQSQSSSASP